MKRVDPEEVVEWCLCFAMSLFLVGGGLGFVATVFYIVWKGYTKGWAE